MNFAQVNEPSGESTIFQTLLLFHAFELFVKSYDHQNKTGKILNKSFLVQTRLSVLSEWWVKRKNRQEKDFVEDQMKLIELVRLREYL